MFTLLRSYNKITLKEMVQREKIETTNEEIESREMNEIMSRDDSSKQCSL